MNRNKIVPTKRSLRVTRSHSSPSSTASAQPSLAGLSSSSTCDSSPILSPTKPLARAKCSLHLASATSSETLVALVTPITDTTAPPEQRPMSYSNLAPHHIALRSHKFVTVSDLLEVLTRRSLASHSVHEERAATIAAINDVPTSYIFDPATRFPENVALVDPTDGNVSALVRRYVQSLDYGERTMEREAEGTRPQRFSSLDDKTLAANKTLDKLLRTLSRNPGALDGVYVRATFEQRHGLVWQ